jgi:hypothetical protein
VTTDTFNNSVLVASRIAAGLFGGYAFTWGFVSLSITLSLLVGMDYDDAYALTMMLAFLVFLAVVFWSVAAAGLARVWIVLTGGGAVMTVTAWMLSRFLLNHA